MRKVLSNLAAAGGLAITAATPAIAQSAGARPPEARDEAPAVPRARELCRILMPGLPPERQPPPLDCDAARRQAAIAGGEVVVLGREPRGTLRFDVAGERDRRDTALREARAAARDQADRDRDWRDGTWDDRDRFDEEDLRVRPD